MQLSASSHHAAARPRPAQQQQREQTRFSFGLGHRSRHLLASSALADGSSSSGNSSASTPSLQKQTLLSSSNSSSSSSRRSPIIARAAAPPAPLGDAAAALRAASASPDARRAHDEIGTLLVQCPDAKGVVARCALCRGGSAVPRSSAAGRLDARGWGDEAEARAPRISRQNPRDVARSGQDLPRRSGARTPPPA